ncbi:MAG: ATP-binding protein, partial [Acidimicrobiales bacterium]
MRCPTCEGENPNSKRFCVSCGEALAVTCATCGAKLEAGYRFCGDCGAPAATASKPRAAISQPAGPGATEGSLDEALPRPPSEVRHVSVLFCDLVGYTSLAECRDPEETRELLSGYFELTKSIIGRYGGIVEKFIGDAVMAVWGAPLANEDDAERSVRAGLEIASSVPIYGSSAGVELSCRVGIATGIAATAGEAIVVGDRVNTAARIQATATASSCVVDTTTQRLSERAISYEDLGAHELKGKSEPEHLFKALRVLSGVGGRLRSFGPEAALVGRESELRALTELFHSCVDRRIPRLVVVSGPAGVGKSRLGFEFTNYVDGLVDAVLWHSGRCLSYGEGVAYWALSEIVRQRLGIAEEDPPEVERTKLLEGLVRFVKETERDYVAVRLARLLGIDLGDGQEQNLPREELFAGWRLFFERLAAVSPVVLVIEDAQHADADLLGFLDHLVDWTKELSLFVLVFARPELGETRPGFGLGRNRSSLSLDPLEKDSMSQLIDDLVPGLGEEQRSLITSRAEGIPLFAVECVRSLIDTGSVVATGSGYRLAGEIGALPVPDTLHGLLASRLDALEDETRSLLGAASVLGSSFAAEALVFVTRRDRDVVAHGLAELVRRGVLEVSADPLSPERGDYRFAQEMLREVAYETSPKKERKTRHLAVTEHLRKAFSNDGEEISEVIAQHYLDALFAGPDDNDAGAILEQALLMLVRGGERSERAGAPSKAEAVYARAARLLRTPRSDTASTPVETREQLLGAARLFEKAARAAIRAASLDSAMKHARAARDIYLEQGEVRDAARARSLAGRALGRGDSLSEARAELEAALAVLRQDPDHDTVQALTSLAGVERAFGTSEADGLSAEALAMGQDLAVGPGLLSELFKTRGNALSIANRHAEAVSCLREAARLAEIEGDAERLGHALVDISAVTIISDPAGAADAARTSAEHARRIGSPYMLEVAAVNLSVALLELGRWDEAGEALTETTGGAGYATVYLDRYRALLAALRGDTQAVGHADMSSFAGPFEDPQATAEVALVAAYAAEVGGDHTEALEQARSVLSQAPLIGMRHECTC